MKVMNKSFFICCSYIISKVFANVGPTTFVNRATLDASVNPYERGCLFSNGIVPNIRVCNSEDPPNASELGICRIPTIDYMEIRIHSDVWESVAFEAWILQIILSEILGVPATVEPGVGGSLNFYHHDAPFTFGESGSNDALQRAHDIIDCRKANRDIDNYQACTHIDPERWTGIQYDSPLQDMVYNNVVEPPQTLGTLGLETWFITKFTATIDPTLDSYLGLMGDTNRQKLAETFKRPTSWYDYCNEVSSNNCTSPDSTAQRPPETTEENDQFFSEGNYIGHFRYTDDNDCDANPTNCTGHVADFPCGSNSYVIPQIHYLNIALKSTGPEGAARGYSYSQLAEMWKAANATKSNLIMQYWSPETLYQEFLGTDAEFIRVTMPSRSQECLDTRRPQADMCSTDLQTRIGNETGICEESAKPLYKVLVGNLYEATHDEEMPEAIHSPAYDALQLFQISELQLGQIFGYRRIEATPRDAVCRWVTENKEYLDTFIPRSYPRDIRNNDNTDDPLVYVATILGGLTTVVVMITWIMVHRNRDIRAIRVAQIEFLYLLLAGSFAIGVGAIIVGLPPTNGTCVTAIWLINLGYTLELVPLIVKVAAVNKLMGAARQFRRIVLTRRSLFGAVLVISTMVFCFLLIWTILDPPLKNQEYSLTNDIDANNHTIVDVVYYCSSDSIVWDYVAVGWNLLLLLCASVLAFQTRTLQKDFNESQTLAFLIYSHFVFVILRLIILLLSGSTGTDVTLFNGLRSLIFSIDTITTIVIYFVPKFFTSAQQNTFSSMFMNSNGNLSGQTSGMNANHNGSSSNMMAPKKLDNDVKTTATRNSSETTAVQISNISLDSVQNDSNILNSEIQGVTDVENISAFDAYTLGKNVDDDVQIDENHSKAIDGYNETNNTPMK